MKELMNQVKNNLILAIIALISIPVLFLITFREQSFQLDETIARSLREKSNVTLVDIKGSTFELEIASTNQELLRGLMGRNTLAPYSGMFFVFPDEQFRTFWMKDTLIPLDIIFLDNELKVINFFQNAEPLNIKARYSAIAPAKYVIELNGGTIDQLNLSTGDQIKILSSL